MPNRDNPVRDQQLPEGWGCVQLSITSTNAFLPTNMPAQDTGKPQQKHHKDNQRHCPEKDSGPAPATSWISHFQNLHYLWALH